MKRPRKSDLPSPQVQEFRLALTVALNEIDEDGRTVGDAKFGVYAFYDFDGEPIYVGQTNEKLRTRIRRHMTNQRTDAVAMRVLDPFEVASIQMWPLWDLQGKNAKSPEVKDRLNEVEYSAYVLAIRKSKFRAILNEKIPPVMEIVDLPEARVHELVTFEPDDERWHPDVRIARRAETISRLAAVARERGAVSDGLRRVLVIQAIRLTFLAATRLSEALGEQQPDPAAIDAEALAGNLLSEDPESVDEEELEEEELES